MSKANANAHISLHITASRPNGYLVVQPRNPNGTFASPFPAARTSASTFHSIDYTKGVSITRGRLQ